MCVGHFVDSGSPRKGEAEYSPQGGKGTKNMDRVTRPTPTADTLFSSCENETNVKMRKIGSLGQ